MGWTGVAVSASGRAELPCSAQRRATVRSSLCQHALESEPSQQVNQDFPVGFVLGVCVVVGELDEVPERHHVFWVFVAQSHDIVGDEVLVDLEVVDGVPAKRHVTDPLVTSFVLIPSLRMVSSGYVLLYDREMV